MTSLSKKARVAGLLYMLASLAGVVRLAYIPNVLFVRGDAMATANNILAHEALFRWGMVGELLAAVLWLFVPLALYRLLEDVDRRLAILMVILGSLMQVPLFVANVVTDAAALMLARGGGSLSVLDQAPRDAFARLFLDLHHQLDLANAVFWGVWLIPFGLLVYRSRFLPRVLGVWLILACIAWLAFSVTGFLFPGHEDEASSYGQPLLLGEIAMILWLGIMGAKEPRLQGLK